MRKFRIFTALLFSLILVICGTFSSAAGESGAVVSANSPTANVGDEVTVDISITDNPGVCSANLVIEYDNTILKPVRYEDGSFAMTSNLNFSANSAKLSYAGAKDNTADGIMFSIVFEAIAAGESDITVTVNKMGKWDDSTSATVQIQRTVENGKVTVQQSAPAESESVAFETNGGTPVPETQYVQTGSVAAEPEAPAKEGFVFKGWFTDAACTNAFDFNTPVTENIILYAGWEQAPAEYCTVVFNMQDHGQTPNPQVVQKGSTASEPAAPSAEGFEFKGWFTDAACTNAFDFSTPVTSDTTVYAGWKENVSETYTVLFSANGHGTAPAAQQVESGKTVTKPADLSAEGFMFRGWFTDKECTKSYAFSTPVMGNITIYAGWEEIIPEVYTVTFIANGHGTAPAYQLVTEGNTAAEPQAPSETGFVFTGWYTDSACTAAYNFSTPVTGNISLYAGWKEAPPATYTVTFNANGHGVSPASQTVTKGNTAAEPEDLIAVGYEFTGWYTDAACTTAYSFSSPVNSSITLYAGWKEKAAEKFTVTFNMNGHGAAVASQSVESGKTATKPEDPYADGYIFKGWFRNAMGVSEYDFSTPVTRNTVIYACWQEKIVTKYTVSFNTCGHGVAPSSQVVEEGRTAVEPTAPSASGYTFHGWYQDSAYTKLYDFSAPVTANTQLYAKWSKNETPSEDTLSVEFYSRYGTTPATQLVKQGEKASEPEAPSQSGYIFGGWYKDQSCTTKYNFSSPVTKSIILYAKWTSEEEKASSYIVEFNCNGHGLTPAAQTVKKGSCAVEPTMTEVSGYTFSGWYTEQACINRYDFSSQVSSDMILYAKWASNTQNQENTPDDDTDDNGSKTGDGDDEKTEDSEKTEKTGIESTEENPQTGDTSGTPLWIFMGLFAGLTAVFSSTRIRKISRSSAKR